MNEEEYNKMREEMAAASLAADLAKEYPESYTRDEMIDITGRLDKVGVEAIRLVRDDFSSLSKREQDRLLTLLAEKGEQSKEWWVALLRQN